MRRRAGTAAPACCAREASCEAQGPPPHPRSLSPSLSRVRAGLTRRATNTCDLRRLCVIRCPTSCAIALPADPRFDGATPVLTRRRDPEGPDCWLVYYREVQVGTIARLSGVRVVDQWRWMLGFYPRTGASEFKNGTGATFEAASAGSKPPAARSCQHGRKRISRPGATSATTRHGNTQCAIEASGFRRNLPTAAHSASAVPRSTLRAAHALNAHRGFKL